MILSAVLFAAAAVGGVLMVAIRSRSGKNPPLAIALIHGLAAAAALVLLVIPVMTTDVPSTARAAATLFVLAALGGFVLFATHLRGKLVSLPLSVVHGGVAVCGFALLVLALVG